MKKGAGVAVTTYSR